ncbi:MAG: hypothetical protein K8W52_12285 [Deltaproteobacteria bacterium]|nr:hypothetical protein [Deltaproteobacteria bacterium]
MRTSSHVLVAYLVLLVVASVWRLLPLVPHAAAPDVGGLVAAYLGLTARGRIAPAVAGAVMVGYLADLLGGAPTGLHAVVGGLVCILGHLVHRRILVRGLTMTLAFSAFVGAAAAVAVVIISELADRGLALGSTGRSVLQIALGTGAIGPTVFWLHRRVDAAFARTHRERDAALEGITS